MADKEKPDTHHPSQERLCFRRLITFLSRSIAAAPLFSLCLKYSCLFKVPPPYKAQPALIGQVPHSALIGQQRPAWVGNVLRSHFTWFCFRQAALSAIRESGASGCHIISIIQTLWLCRGEWSNFGLFNFAELFTFTKQPYETPQGKNRKSNHTSPWTRQSTVYLKAPCASTSVPAGLLPVTSRLQLIGRGRHRPKIFPWFHLPVHATAAPVYLSARWRQREQAPERGSAPWHLTAAER